MERAGSDLTAFGETVVFLDYFKDLPDPRQAGKVIYPLPEVLLLCLLAVLAGAETFVDIAPFGEKKIALLRRFRPFCHGTPAHDHLGDILSVLDAEQFQRCFRCCELMSCRRAIGNRNPGIERLGDDPPLLQCRPSPAASHPGAYLHPPKRKLRVAYSVGHMCETFPPNQREACDIPRASIKLGAENRLPRSGLAGASSSRGRRVWRKTR